jgi:hypothetical protein
MKHVCLVVSIAIVVCASRLNGVPPLNVDGAAPAIPPLSEKSAKRYQWVKEQLSDAYDRVGRHDPKWDASARLALSLSVDMWGPPRVIGSGNRAQFEAATAAVEAGCDDPIVLFAYARTFLTFGKDAAACIDHHRRAADGLLKSGYGPYYKALSQLRYADVRAEAVHEARVAAPDKAVGAGDRWADVAAHVNVALSVAKDLAKEKDVPLDQWIDLGDTLSAVTDNYTGGVKWVIANAYPTFERVAPPSAALTVKGRLYTTWAFQARGKGAGSQVTAGNRRLMGERLAVAQEALERAWELDTSNAAAAARMIGVELGQGQGRARMEQWFKRAMDADPDSEAACNQKLLYLEPKWYGSPAEMLAFGRECVKGGRFRSDVPGTLRQAHIKLSHYTHGRWLPEQDAAYFQTPGVWVDLRAVHEGYLRAERDRDPTLTRNRYAHEACLCRAWADAVKMFAVIGDGADSRVWSQARFEAARAEAIAAATKK